MRMLLDLAVVFQAVIVVLGAAPQPLNSSMPSFITASSFARHSSSQGKARKNITLIASLNYAGQLFATMSLGTKAIQLALDRVKHVGNLLPDYELIIEPFDDYCTRADTVYKTVTRLNENDRSRDRFPLALGPFCSGHLYTGEILHHYSFAGLTGGTNVPDLQMDRKKYRSYQVLSTSPKTGFLALVNFLHHFRWHKIAILSEIAPYWSVLENEMIREMEARNMTLLGLFKIPFISGIPPDQEQIKMAVEDLAIVDPRVIIINSNTPARVACLLYRCGLHGRNFVFFMQGIYAFYSNDPSRYSWCTEVMLAEILESTFVFGDASKVDLPAAEAVDETGFSLRQLDFTLQSWISDQIVDSSVWSAFRLPYYEMTLFAAYWLDATEALLKLRNQTLSDWFVSGPLFKRDGEDFLKLMDKSLCSFTMKGLRRDYQFDPTTMDNSRGLSPIAISQQRRINNSNLFAPTPVAIYMAGNETLHVLPNEITWRTKDGLPPSDVPLIIHISISAMSKQSQTTLFGFGAFGIICNMTILILQIIEWNKAPLVKSSLAHLNKMILTGNCIISLHVLFLPINADSFMGQGCSMVYALVAIGSCLIISAIYVKVEIGAILIKRKQKSITPSKKALNGSKNSKPSVLKRSKVVNEMSRYGYTFLLVINSVIATFCLLWLSSNPVKTAVTESPLQKSSADSSIFYQISTYECRVVVTSTLSYVCLAGLVSIPMILLVRSCLIAYIYRKATCPDIPDFRKMCHCAQFAIALALATGVLQAIFWEYTANSELALSWSSVMFVIGNMSLVFIPKLCPGKTILHQVRFASRRESRSITSVYYISRNESPLLFLNHNRRTSLMTPGPCENIIFSTEGQI